MAMPYFLYVIQTAQSPSLTSQAEVASRGIGYRATTTLMPRERNYLFQPFELIKNALNIRISRC
jgi:hypothetical protein